MKKCNVFQDFSTLLSIVLYLVKKGPVYNIAIDVVDILEPADNFFCVRFFTDSNIKIMVV